MEAGQDADYPASHDDLGGIFELFVDHVVDYAIFLLDLNGRVASWNRGAERAKGYRANEILGRHFSVFYLQPDRDSGFPDRQLARARHEGRSEAEGWRVRSDGTTFWAHVVITAIYDREGVLVGYGKVTRDLTSRRMAEQRLEAANEELDRFAAMVAHDLAEPVTTSRGFAELLRRRYGNLLPPDGVDGLDHIASSTERMSEMISKLLTYARSGAVPVRPVRVDEAIDAAREALHGSIHERGAQIDAHVGPEVVVLADPGDVELLLQNLLSNAVKFSDADTPQIEIRAVRDDGRWRVSVADNGPGIAPIDRERIFASFERAGGDSRERGVGLGLAICERIVRRRDGAIGIEADDGPGSTFWFALPASG